MRKTVLLESSKSTSSHRWLHLEDNGDLVIEGHDLGSSVEEFWGEGRTEYEFTRRIRKQSVEMLRSALGVGGGEMLSELATHTSREIETALEDADIPSEFWSRVGD
jgi:hypothetical protein